MNTPRLHGLSSRVVLCILDGFGWSHDTYGNAIHAAQASFLKKAFQDYPFATLEAGGELVGLPKGVAGNSEVGHLNLGAGKPVRQDLVRINEAIEKRTFANLPEWKKLIQKTVQGSKRLHLMGLLSDGGVHSHINHLEYICELLLAYPDFKIYLHAFMDGRDTPKDKGIIYLERILKQTNVKLATLQGRSIGMDRDRRWEKIQRAYDLFWGRIPVNTKSPLEYLKSEYAQGRYDEFIEPAAFAIDGCFHPEDSVFFFNFRPDRAKQITLALNDPHFQEFSHPQRPAHFLCMTPYVQDEMPHLPILFDKEKIPGTLSEVLSKLKKKQFKTAETEKYAHVTYFFNGGEEKLFPLEERALVASPKEVTSYDQKPSMSAYAVKDEVLKALRREEIDFVTVNFANCDMVGHTGKFEATIQAVEAVDKCVAEIADFCLKKNITLVITADHGNADQMLYPDGTSQTSHSGAPVPFCVIHPKLYQQKLTPNPELKDNERALKDVAPTILSILGLPHPSHFQGKAVFL
jgi:2,3-bisphosphoglycerate-independent phosphoglycerate mutase